MEIKKLFERQQEVDNSNQTVRQGKIAAFREQAGESEEVRRAGEDSVRISSLSKRLAQLSEILEEDEAAQATRVAELKRQVGEGGFSVASEDVARSIVSFVADGR